MKNFIKSILLALTLTFTLSFAVPQQAQAKERTAVRLLKAKNATTLFCVITEYRDCSGTLLGYSVDIYDVNGNHVGSYDYDEKGKRI